MTELAKRQNESKGTARLLSAYWQGSTEPAARLGALLLVATTLGRDLTETTQEVYLASLEDFSKDDCIRAFTLALHECKFFPTPGELRELAGIPTAAQQERAAARRALQDVLEAIRKHGPELRPIPGAILTDKGEDGRLLDIPLRAPSTPAPSFMLPVNLALTRLGYGDRRQGVLFLASHPALGSTTEFPTVARQAEEIEKRWFEAYGEVGR